MSARIANTLPPPPDGLAFCAVKLTFVEPVPGDDARGLAPSYHFRIVLDDGREAGHINFRVGDSDHVMFCAGHIGFGVSDTFRGHGYAFQACRALEPFIRTVYSAVIMTCDPSNAASRRTIEKLGGTFLDEMPVPVGDPQYRRGSRTKLRYRWTPAGK